MKKQKTKKITKLGVLVFLTIIIFAGIASATLYDELKGLKGKNCNLVEKNSLSPFVKADLINKFGLVINGGSNCDVVVDSLPLDSITKNIVGMGDDWYTTFIWYEYPWYAQTIHRFYGNKEYVFILGKNNSVLNTIANLTANYEKYKYYLTSEQAFYLFEDFFTAIYNPEYTGPSDDNCVDSGGNFFADIYTGNSGSYKNHLNGETINFNTTCQSSSMLSYSFCRGNHFVKYNYPCNCVAGKCVIGFSEVFDLFNLYGSGVSFYSEMIDDEFISFALRSWINN